MHALMAIMSLFVLLVSHVLITPACGSMCRTGELVPLAIPGSYMEEDY
jgi:hypothetical protein